MNFFWGFREMFLLFSVRYFNGQLFQDGDGSISSPPKPNLTCGVSCNLKCRKRRLLVVLKECERATFFSIVGLAGFEFPAFTLWASHLSVPCGAEVLRIHQGVLADM